MKKVIKRTAALALSGMLALSCFAGCAADNADPDTSDDAKDKVYTVGICETIQHPALDAATKGFKDALVAKLGDNVKFKEGNASGDSNTCSTIVNGYVSEGVDLIMANATPALGAAATATATIPIVGVAITNFAVALDPNTDNPGAKTTGRNITGAADLADVEKQAQMIKEWFPKVKQVGILYCSGEANSKYQVSLIEGYFDKMGIPYKEYTVADTAELASVTKLACDDNEVLYIPTDNTIASATETVNNVAQPAGIPIFAAEKGICTGAGVAALSIDYYNSGYKAGEMAYEILVNGKDPATMEIAYEEEQIKLYDKARCEALGLTVPEGYEAIV